MLQKRDANKYKIHLQKMSRDVGMVVPKTTENRCRDGSVQYHPALSLARCDRY